MTADYTILGLTDPRDDYDRDMVRNLWPYYVEFGYQGSAERDRKTAWLIRTFGVNDSWRSAVYNGGYYFRREQDLTLFRLWAA